MGDVKITAAKKKTELQRLLSKLGIASRSQAAKLIKAGKVSVNGKINKDPFAYISVAAKIVVEQASAPTASSAEKVLIAFNKPKGVVTTASDEKGRKTVYEVLPKEFQHLKPVGRLDMATTGLLLFTNDPYLADALLDPKNQVKRTYVVTVNGAPSQHAIDRLCGGIQDAGEILRAKEIEVRKKSGKETILIVTLEEGKNREIRRMFKAVNHEVIKLKRIAFGEIELGDLAVGTVRVVSWGGGVK